MTVVWVEKHVTAGMRVTVEPVEFCEYQGHSFVSDASRVNSFCA